MKNSAAYSYSCASSIGKMVKKGGWGGGGGGENQNIIKLELHEAHVPRANINMTILLNAHVAE